MNNIGMNATMMTKGVLNPTKKTTKPSVAARLYAGAVEATPITMLASRLSAPFLRPFSAGTSAYGRATSAAVMATPPRELQATVVADFGHFDKCFRRIRPSARRDPGVRSAAMRVLVMGAGGVGSAFARIAARRDVVEHVVLAEYDEDRAARAAAAAGDRFSAVRVDAADEQSVADLLRTARCDVLVNATDPRFVMPLFEAALAAETHYLDMAMSLSHPHPDRPYAEPGVKLGDEQFALAAEWEKRGTLALVGMGVEPGLSDVFARHAADELFAAIDEGGVRDGADLTVEGYAFAPTFSIWTTIEECLNPPVIYERERGWFTTPPFSEP